MPTQAALDAQNKLNLDAVPDGGTISFRQSMRVVAIGYHDVATQNEIDQGFEPSDGTIKVVRTIISGPGELQVWHPGGQRSEFEEAVGRITNKEIRYVS